MDLLHVRTQPEVNAEYRRMLEEMEREGVLYASPYDLRLAYALLRSGYDARAALREVGRSRTAGDSPDLPPSQRPGRARPKHHSRQNGGKAA